MVPVQSTHASTLSQVEAITGSFRDKLARKHRSVATEARKKGRELLEIAAQCFRDSMSAPPGLAGFPDDLSADIHDVETRDRWHAGRADGQIYRFRNLNRCGYRWRQASCKNCDHDRAQVPESCGIRRLCLQCSFGNARKRQARYGRGRARVVVEGYRAGRMMRGDPERYGERFLTLTNQHWTLSEVEAHLRELEAQRDAWQIKGDAFERLAAMRGLRILRGTIKRTRKILEGTEETGDVGLRISMLWAAWPRFRKKLGDHLKDRGHKEWKLHRSAEWTPGHDRAGHPHFHLWIWSPFIDDRLVAQMWTDSLREVGAPFEWHETAIIDLRALKSPNLNLARELLKGDDRQAIRFARLESKDGRPMSAGEQVVAYADGWTIWEIIESCDPDTIAQVYMGFEAKRFTQASAGFFLEQPPLRCEICNASSETPGGGFRIWFTPRHDHEHHEPEERGPPS